MPVLRREPTYPCALFLLFLLLASLGSGEAAGANDARMAACDPVSCGKGPNVTYPFWIQGKQPPYCGMRLFMLICDGANPLLSVSGDNYTVANISYNRRTIDINKRVLDSCDHFPNNNLTLDRTPFTVSNTSNATLFFFLHCDTTKLASPGTTFLRQLPCSSNLSSYVWYSPFQQPPPDQASQLLQACHPPLILHVNPFPFAPPHIRSHNHLLDFRITLNWKSPDCPPACRATGGRCGTNYTDNNAFNLICICSDRDHQYSCGGQRKSNVKKFLIIGFAVCGAGAVALSMILLIICRKRYKETKRSASLSKLIRSGSSEGYSMENDVEALSTQTHIFTYKELEDATQGFDESNELGDGGFGTVYKGKLRDGRVVAIKRLYENNFKREEQFLNEVAILNRLRHKNLVSLYGCTSRHSRGLLLVYEYVPNGTVADHLHGPRAEEGALTWPVRMSIAVETAGALAYLHAVEPQIIHRDVKTNNILLDENYHVKVADFGLSRLFPPDATHVSTVPQGTPGYLDPEYHRCYQLTDKSDVYSFGVVLAELISSKPAVDITRKRNDINLASMAVGRIQNCQLQEFADPLLGYDSNEAVRIMIEQVAELAFRCLQAEKEMRPSMEEVLDVLKGLTGAASDTGKGVHNHLGGKGDLDSRKHTEDCASLLNGSQQDSPVTVHAEWVSRNTTPNTSGQAFT